MRIASSFREYAAADYHWHNVIRERALLNGFRMGPTPRDLRREWLLRLVVELAWLTWGALLVGWWAAAGTCMARWALRGMGG